MSPFHSLFILPFALLDPFWQRGLFVATMLVCYLSFRQYRAQIAALFGIASFFALTPTFANKSLWFGDRSLLLNHFAQGAATIGLIMLIRQATKSRRKLPDWAVGPIVLVLFFPAVALLYVERNDIPFGEGMLIGAFFIFCKFVWVALVDLTEKRRPSPPSLGRQSLAYAFFAKSFFYMPIPFNSTLYDGISTQEAEISRNQRSGFYLFAQATVVLFVIHVLIQGVRLDFFGARFEHDGILLAKEWDLMAVLQDRVSLSAMGIVSAWRVLYVHFVIKFASYWANGNFVVAIFRLLGFRVFRNTYKVWRARSVFEYFQRFAFYFKELLSRYFFYPAFFYLRGVSVRVRMALAIVYSVGFGNLLFHAMARVSSVGFARGKNIPDQWPSFQSYAIYCVLFSCILTISFFRNHWRKQPVNLTRGRHFVRLFFILHIYVFLQIFEADTYATLNAQITFLQKLVGL